jgi:hypothetical protein
VSQPRATFAPIAALMCCALSAQSRADAISPQDYAYGSPLEVDGRAALYLVILSEDVYRHSARPDLSDVRVVNGLNEEVPFAIRRPAQARAEPAAFDALPLFPLRGADRAPSEALKFRLRASGASIDLEQPADQANASVTAYLVDIRGSQVPVTALRLTWMEGAADFSNRLRVEASDDLTHWQLVEQGFPIVNLHYAGQSFVRPELKLRAQRSSFLRLSWVDAAASEPVLTAVSGQRQISALEPPRQIVAVAAAAASPPGDYEFDLGAHFPIDRLNLRLPETNTVVETQFLVRPDESKNWRAVGSARLYRLQTPGTDELSNPPLSVTLNPERHWRAHITLAGGDVGSGIPTLEAGWLADELLFLARGPAPFQLLYGNASASPVPPSRLALDAGSLSTRDGPIEAHPAALGAARTLGGNARLKAGAPPIDLKRWILWSVLVVGVCALGTMAWKLARGLR